MPYQYQPSAAIGGVRIQDPAPLEPITDRTPSMNSSPFTGDELYHLVETYAGFGEHLTGSYADHNTTDWLAGRLRDLGATVELPTFDFQQYVCNAILRSGDATVPALPLYYSGYGRWETANVQVVELETSSVAGNATALDPLVDGSAGNRALALALNSPDDLPVQCNRVPAVKGEHTGPGQPTVVIPRNWADRVRNEAVLSFDASLRTATSRNVVAVLGSPDRRRVTVTTPLTGWTPCAGERGTGIAAALALAVDLSGDHYVVLVGGSGHELDHLGIRNYLATNGVENQPVIHLGASVGAVEWEPDGSARLGSERLALSSVPDLLRPGLAERVIPGRFTLANPDQWPGEGGTWRQAGASVLSFLGTFEHFHVATDLPAVATTGPALVTAVDAVIKSARYVLSGGQL